MDKLIKVNICVPSYNSEKFIKQCITSILSQSYKNFILHIADDCSTDNTLKIVKSFKDKRIVIHTSKKNIGIFPNLNKCIDIAKSEYLKIVCADDLLESNCIKKQVKILETYPDVVLVYNASYVINKYNRVLFKRKFFNNDRKINGGVLINKILKTGRNPIGEPTSIMLRSRILKKFSLKFGVEFRYVGDLDLWIKLLAHGNTYYIYNSLNSFRIYKNSSSAKILDLSNKEYLDLVAFYSDEFCISILDRILIYIKLTFYVFIKKILFLLVK